MLCVLCTFRAVRALHEMRAPLALCFCILCIFCAFRAYRAFLVLRTVRVFLCGAHVLRSARTVFYLDQTKYGTFAEIGAGQEVARWFFRVGGASGTIAKTISAYDMMISDAIYGQSDRYVSRQRLHTMLDHEYTLLLERLRGKRGGTTKFFVFADTVAAQSYTRRDECHGWMGVRFQAEPMEEPSQMIIHVRMLDKENLQQQEALGVMGVNLVYGALYLHDNLGEFVGSLKDRLTSERVEVDMIKFSGPAFQSVDNRLMSLQLVQHGLTNAAMFTADGEVVQAAEVLYKKAILVERGSFRPVTMSRSTCSTAPRPSSCRNQPCRARTSWCSWR